MAVGELKCSASIPIHRAPIGMKPKKLKLYTPITLPRNSSETSVCVNPFERLFTAIIPAPIPTKIKEDIMNELLMEKRIIKTGSETKPTINTFPLARFLPNEAITREQRTAPTPRDA